jgi:hypothetical protein
MEKKLGIQECFLFIAYVEEVLKKRFSHEVLIYDEHNKESEKVEMSWKLFGLFVCRDTLKKGKKEISFGTVSGEHVKKEKRTRTKIWWLLAHPHIMPDVMVNKNFHFLDKLKLHNLDVY